MGDDLAKFTKARRSVLGARSMIEKEISNADLRLSDIPRPDASRRELEKFALTFDGYRHWGSFEKCAVIATARRHDSLTNLRTCLFFEQRKIRWADPDEPDDEQMEYMRLLVDGIRTHLIKTTSKSTE